MAFAVYPRLKKRLAAAELKAKLKVLDESQPRKIPQQKSNAPSRETGGKKTKARRDPVLPSFPARTRTHMRTPANPTHVEQPTFETETNNQDKKKHPPPRPRPPREPA